MSDLGFEQQDLGDSANAWGAMANARQRKAREETDRQFGVTLAWILLVVVIIAIVVIIGAALIAIYPNLVTYLSQ